jgi:hypothetical protein
MRRRRPDPPPPIDDLNERLARDTAAHYAPIWNVPVHVVTQVVEAPRRRVWFWTSLPPDRCARNGWTIEATITPSPEGAS